MRLGNNGNSQDMITLKKDIFFSGAHNIQIPEFLTMYNPVQGLPCASVSSEELK